MLNWVCGEAVSPPIREGNPPMTELAVAAHYTHGTLLAALDQAIAAAGKDPQRITAADLAPATEFHIGGRHATAEFAVALAAALSAPKGKHLLDIGCGIGGPARLIAQELDCVVTGIDLSAE
jgi:SAM-dependent methyltransferase